MTISKAWLAVVAIAVALAAALGGYEWFQEHDARAKAEMQTAVQQRSIDAQKAEASGIQAGLAAQLSALAAEKAKPATAQRVVDLASKLIPSLPAPIQIEEAPAPGTGPAQPNEINPTRATPTQPPEPQANQLVIPAVDFQAIQNAEIACQENAARLDACAKTAALTQAELAETEVEVKSWKTAAKGGTWIHRTLTAAKWIGISVGTGYVLGRKF
jgi:hypothetical protein